MASPDTVRMLILLWGLIIQTVYAAHTDEFFTLSKTNLTNGLKDYVNNTDIVNYETKLNIGLQLKEI